MSKGLLDPKVDFVFKNIFGSEKNTDILISFLNAALKPKKKITAVEIKETDINKQYIEDTASRLDIKATTSNGDIINIEIQLKNEYNMIKRSIYYLSKLYEGQISEGDNYSELNRMVYINILNFDYLKTDNFHTVYRLKEVDSNEELTDAIELHFVEITKLNNDNEEDLLAAWVEFLKNPESEKVRTHEMKNNEIRKAKDELIRISNDEKQRIIYSMKMKALSDEKNALATVESRTKITIAKSLLDILDNETISSKTGLRIEDIELLRNGNYIEY